VPVQRIRKLNIDGKLHVGTLKAFQITTTDADVTITAHDGKLQVDPMHAKLYGGSYDGSIEVNAQGATPSVSTNETVSQVHLGGLAQALFKAKRLTGTGNMKVALKGQGKTVGDIRSALNGKLSFALKNGAITGIDIWGAIRRAYALIKGRSAPASNGPARTQFADLSGTGTVDNGVLHNRNLLAKLPFLRVTGSGSIDLVQALVDYNIKAKVVKTPEFDQNKKLDQLAGITIPLKIDGNLSDMHVLPDLAAALKGKVKQKVEKTLKKKLQNLFHLNKKHNKSSGHSKSPPGPGHALRLRNSDSESLNLFSPFGDGSASLKPSPLGRG
jgi:AsmA protein